MVTVGKRQWWAGGIVAVAITLMGGLVIWEASRALKASKQEIQAEREIGFVLRPFVPSTNINFETVRSAGVFAQVEHFQDCLYVAGPAGLSQYDLHGNFLRKFPAGRDLHGSRWWPWRLGSWQGRLNRN